MHLQEDKEAEVGPELPRKGSRDRVQLSALQRGERGRLPPGAEPHRHPLEHLRDSQPDGQARAGTSALDEGSDPDPGRVDHQNQRPGGRAKGRGRGQGDKKAGGSSDRALHRVPQHRRGAGVPEIIPSLSEFLRESRPVGPQVSWSRAPNDPEYERGP